MKFTQRDLRNVEKQVKYNLSLPADLYEKAREISHKKRQTLAYTFQTALEEYIEHCEA